MEHRDLCTRSKSFHHRSTQSFYLLWSFMLLAVKRSCQDVRLTDRSESQLKPNKPFASTSICAWSTQPLLIEVAALITGIAINAIFRHLISRMFIVLREQAGASLHCFATKAWPAAMKCHCRLGMMPVRGHEKSNSIWSGKLN